MGANMIDFPQTPTLNQEYSYLDNKWVWTGHAWAKAAPVATSAGLAHSIFQYSVQAVTPAFLVAQLLKDKL